VLPWSSGKGDKEERGQAVGLLSPKIFEKWKETLETHEKTAGNQGRRPMIAIL